MRRDEQGAGQMQPLTFYADTANWIDLAEGSVDSGPLRNAIADARIVPVLSLVHLLELAANANTAGRDRVADYMDSLQGPFKWIKHYRDVIRQEATACFKEMFGGRWEFPVAFFDSFHETLPDADPEIIMTVGEDMPRRISEMVDALLEIEEFQKYLDDCRHYPDLRQRIAMTRSARAAKKRFTEAEKRSWLAESLPDHVDMALVVPIGDDLRREFAESVDLTKCPAFRANWAFHEGANLDPKSARKSDIPDLWHLTGVAYCNVAFADKGTVEALRKGAYDKLPKRNSEFREWVRSLA